MRCYYMAVTDDAYELPLLVTDTAKKLSDWAGYKDKGYMLPSIIRSSDGMVRVKKRNARIFRMNFDGEIIVGAIQKGGNHHGKAANERYQA